MQKRGAWLLPTALAAALVVGLMAGCAGPVATAPGAATSGSAPASASTPAGAPVSPAPSTPGQVRLAGAVHRPVTLTSERLGAMPNRTVQVRFGTEKGSQQHTETGVSLFDLIDAAGPVLMPGRKHDELSIGVLVIGSDGYRALLSYGELAPELGNGGALLATSQDGHPLDNPRLVLPGDAQGARYVCGVTELDVVHVG